MTKQAIQNRIAELRNELDNWLNLNRQFFSESSLEMLLTEFVLLITDHLEPISKIKTSPKNKENKIPSHFVSLKSFCDDYVFSRYRFRKDVIPLIEDKTFFCRTPNNKCYVAPLPLMDYMAKLENIHPSLKNQAQLLAKVLPKRVTQNG